MESRNCPGCGILKTCKTPEALERFITEGCSDCRSGNRRPRPHTSTRKRRAALRLLASPRHAERRTA